MSFRKLKTLVVEDETAIRQELVNALNEIVDIEVIGEADSVEEAYNLVKSVPAELMFLDIKLIGGTAFDLLAQLKKEGIRIPPVVVNTGFRDFEFAQRIHNEFGQEVIAILKKPFYEDWEKHQADIIETVYNRIQENRLSSQPASRSKLLPIKDGRQLYMVNPDDVVLVRTASKGEGKSKLVFADDAIECQLSMAQLLDKLPHTFIQINRWEAINMDWVKMVDQSNKEVHLRNGESLLIGGAFYKTICNFLGV
jgi:two-component system LytT family response regulator